MPAKGDRLGLAMAPTAPLVIRGDVPVQGWTPRVLPAAKDEMLATLASLYAADPLLGPAFAEGLASLSAWKRAAPAYHRSGPRPSSPWPARPASSWPARPASASPRLELDGWDTHQGQGTREGRLARQLGILDRGLGALRESLGDAWRETALIAATEFGRTVAANGTGGTDHGTAGAAFVAGGTVAGGRVLSPLAGLAPDRLYQGRDLAADDRPALAAEGAARRPTSACRGRRRAARVSGQRGCAVDSGAGGQACVRAVASGGKHLLAS